MRKIAPRIAFASALVCFSMCSYVYSRGGCRCCRLLPRNRSQKAVMQFTPAPETQLAAQAAISRNCPCCGDNCLCAAGKPCGKPNCPCVLPGAVIEGDGSVNFGLDVAHMQAARKPIYAVNGVEVGKGGVLQVLAGKPSWKDDSTELCLTVIGSTAERQSVLNDLASNTALSPWKGRLKLQACDPSHWAVKDTGFVTTGHPTIYCQSADGKVLHRQDDYRGAEALAEALRKADPNYQPASDPDMTKPANVAGLPLPSLAELGRWLGSVPAWVWIALALLLYLRFKGKKL